jgi:ribonuclease HII
MARRWRDRALLAAGGVLQLDSPLDGGQPDERPTIAAERALADQGYVWVAGVDEVGRGALAGPLVAAAVVLPPVTDDRAAAALLATLAGARDSKALTPAQRVRLAAVVRQVARGVGLAVVPPAALDAMGLGPANRLSLRLAVADLPAPPDYALLDALLVPGLACDQAALVRGDSRSLSIAAASIVAKVARDAILDRLARAYPAYGFDRHKGYATAEHLAALAAHGPCPQHRASFAPVRDMVAGLLPAGAA